MTGKTMPLAFLCLAAVVGAPAPAQAPPQPRPPACATAAHRAFDFWVGEWEVFRTGTDRQVARSRIEKLYDGCAIRENWMPLGPGGGGSLTSWIPEAGQWRQTWVDASNAWVVFEGGPEKGAMVLTGLWKGAKGPGSTPLVRMTYTPGADGTVRQFGESSEDGGATWAPFFDLTYRPAAAR